MELRKHPFFKLHVVSVDLRLFLAVPGLRQYYIGVTVSLSILFLLSNVAISRNRFLRLLHVTAAVATADCFVRLFKLQAELVFEVQEIL